MGLADPHGNNLTTHGRIRKITIKPVNNERDATKTIMKNLKTAGVRVHRNSNRSVLLLCRGKRANAAPARLQQVPKSRRYREVSITAVTAEVMKYSKATPCTYYTPILYVVRLSCRNKWTGLYLLNRGGIPLRISPRLTIWSQPNDSWNYQKNTL